MGGSQGLLIKPPHVFPADGVDFPGREPGALHFPGKLIHAGGVPQLQGAADAVEVRPQGHHLQTGHVLHVLHVADDISGAGSFPLPQKVRVEIHPGDAAPVR